MTIDFTGKPKRTPQELEKMYPMDILFIVEDILASKKSFQWLFQDLIDIMKYGFEKPEVRKRIVYYKFKKDDEQVREMQLNHFISNLIFWNPLTDVDKVDLLDESWIFDFSTFDSDTLMDYMNTKLLPVYDIDFATQNAMVDEVYHYIISISHAFCLLMGMGVSLYDLHQLELRDPEVSHLIRDPVDQSLEPHEVEQLLESRNDRLIQRMVEDPVGNDYQPFFKSGSALKKAQFREYLVRIGFKADINGNTVPILIDNNFLLHGLNRPSFVYLNAISGRKALILSKLAMGRPGSFSKKMSFGAMATTLREDYEPCDSIHTVDYTIVDDQFLKLLDGRYFYDENGNLMQLEYEVDKDLIGKTVRFRSPATCASKEGVCRFCYGHMFDINQSMASSGSLAALKITEPVGQGILSSKHSQSTSSNELNFSEGYEDIFETNSSMISLKDDSELDADLYIRLGEVEIEEMDDSEFYSCLGFDILNSNGELIRHIEEASGARFYLNDCLVKMYKAKMRTRNPDPVFSLEDLDESEGLFTIEVKNKELTEPLKIFEKVLNNREHMGAKTISEMCQLFAEKLIAMGIKYELVHAEMIIRSLLRKKSNKYEMPDFSVMGNPNDYQILKLDDGIFDNPSVTMSIHYGHLRRQLASPQLYQKTKTGPLDALYLSQLSDVL